jgi:hypothetical protein
VESRCVPIGRRHFLRLHLSANHTPALPISLQDIQVCVSMKEVVFSLEQPHPSDHRSFIIRFLVSRVGPFALSVLLKQQHIQGSPFQVQHTHTHSLSRFIYNTFDSCCCSSTRMRGRSAGRPAPVPPPLRSVPTLPQDPGSHVPTERPPASPHPQNAFSPPMATTTRAAATVMVSTVI